MVCLAPQHFCPPGIYHGALGATVIRTDCWKPAPLLNQKGIILEGPLTGWTPPLGTVQCPYLGKFLGAHPSTFRKLFPAEICFELFVIIFWLSQTLTSAGQDAGMFGSRARSENWGQLLNECVMI